MLSRPKEKQSQSVWQELNLVMGTHFAGLEKRKASRFLRFMEETVGGADTRNRPRRISFVFAEGNTNMLFGGFAGSSQLNWIMREIW